MPPDDLFGPLDQGETKPLRLGKSGRVGAFTDNMRLPIHRWFRYSAGFQAEWAERIIGGTAQSDKILDPFAGCGTALLAAQKVGRDAYGLERHSFVQKIARIKLRWHEADSSIARVSTDIVRKAKELRTGIYLAESDLLDRCFSEPNLRQLYALKAAWSEYEFANEATREYIWLGITCVLRQCSHVGTAQWQYILPNKSKARVAEPFAAFLEQMSTIAKDIAIAESIYRGVRVEIMDADARIMTPIEDKSIACVVTSPPYPNNYDYADATRLEMTFWGEVKNWSDLQVAVRSKLIRSCSQHSAAERLELDRLIKQESVAPIRAKLDEVCQRLAEIRETKGGKKTYHTMVAAYFADMAQVWMELRRVCRPGAQVLFVVGDSAPYGIHVPVDEWLGELALAAGFESYSFEQTRARNIKWRNRKHRVPLKEGILRVCG